MRGLKRSTESNVGDHEFWPPQTYSMPCACMRWLAHRLLAGLWPVPVCLSACLLTCPPMWSAKRGSDMHLKAEVEAERERERERERVTHKGSAVAATALDRG